MILFPDEIANSRLYPDLADCRASSRRAGELRAPDWLLLHHRLMAPQKVDFPVLFVNVGHKRGGWGGLLRLLRKRV